MTGEIEVSEILDSDAEMI